MNKQEPTERAANTREPADRDPNAVVKCEICGAIVEIPMRLHVETREHQAALDELLEGRVLSAEDIEEALSWPENIGDRIIECEVCGQCLLESTMTKHVSSPRHSAALEKKQRQADIDKEAAERHPSKDKKDPPASEFDYLLEI